MQLTGCVIVPFKQLNTTNLVVTCKPSYAILLKLPACIYCAAAPAQFAFIVTWTHNNAHYSQPPFSETWQNPWHYISSFIVQWQHSCVIWSIFLLSWLAQQVNQRLICQLQAKSEVRHETRARCSLFLLSPGAGFSSPPCVCLSSMAELLLLPTEKYTHRLIGNHKMSIAMNVDDMLALLFEPKKI